MKILISNDDGVYSPGLQTLVTTMSSYGEVYVIAPDRDHSAASNSLTLQRPIRTKTLPNGFVAVEGTPSDCVHLALTGFFNTQFDLVVSGINAGANLGDDVLYSGTVAAAMEGHLLNVGAIAFSLTAWEAVEQETASKAIAHIIEAYVREDIPRNCFLNVNIPDIPHEQIRGYQITRLGRRHHAEPTIKDTDVRGRTIYWIGPPGAGQDADIGTDFYAIEQRYVSVTPIQIDLTHYKAMERLSSLNRDIKYDENKQT